MAITPKRSIRVSDELWESFCNLASSAGCSVTEPLIMFMQRCVDDGSLPLTDDDFTSSRIEGKLDTILAAIQSQSNRHINTGDTSKKHWPLAS